MEIRYTPTQHHTTTVDTAFFLEKSRQATALPVLPMVAGMIVARY